MLYLEAVVARLITYVFSLLDRYRSQPATLQPTRKTKIPSKLSHRNGQIELLIYEPRVSTANASRPVVVNIHGGGWIFGTPQMDARWAARVVECGATFISVGYRLAPECPYPIPIEDCVDAIAWVHDHADDLGIDNARMVLTGFSAGGNMVFASAYRLHAEHRSDIALKGIISFYPLLDRSRTPEEKDRRNPVAAEKISTPKRWQSLFRECYLPETSYDLSSPYLSPGLASDDLVKAALPSNVMIWTCEWDALLEEGETFRKRLQSLGKDTSGRIIAEAAHAFDRVPTFKKGNPKMDQMYDEAVVEFKSMLS